MGMKVTGVSIQGFHNVKSKTYSFQNFNYLTGKNASGKTTVLNAIQLALLGYIPGTNRRVSDIFRHSNGKSMEVSVNLVTDTGDPVKISRTWTAIKNNIIGEVKVEPEGYDIENILKDIELPIFNFNDFLSLSANKMKDWFIDFLPKSEFNVDWEAELTNSLPESIRNNEIVRSDIIKEVEFAAGCGKSGVDQIRWMNESLKLGLSYKKSEMDRLTSTIQSMIHYDDVDESDADVPYDKLTEYEDKKERHRMAVAKKLNNNKIDDKINQLKELCTASIFSEDPIYLKYKSECEQLSSEYDALPVPDSAAFQKSVDKVSELRYNLFSYERVSSSKGVCPLTEEYCSTIGDYISENTAKIDELKVEIASELEFQDKFKSASKEYSDRRDAIKSKISALKSAINNIQNNYNSIELLEGSKVAVDEEALNDEVDYDVLMKNIRDRIVKVEANKRYNSIIDTITKQKFDLQSEIEAYKVWVAHTGVNGIQSTSSDYNPFDALSEDMDKKLKAVFSEDVKCKFNVESKANSFSFGLVKPDGAYVPYDLLSSGEKCMYMLCMFTSIVTTSNSRLKLILVDDMFDHLDDVNISKLFESLYTMEDIQMIFAGVKDIGYEKFSGNIINIEEDK